jgi:hypothetical protein
MDHYLCIPRYPQVWYAEVLAIMRGVDMRMWGQPQPTAFDLHDVWVENHARLDHLLKILYNAHPKRQVQLVRGLNITDIHLLASSLSPAGPVSQLTRNNPDFVNGFLTDNTLLPHSHPRELHGRDEHRSSVSSYEGNRKEHGEDNSFTHNFVEDPERIDYSFAGGFGTSIYRTPLEVFGSDHMHFNM